MAFLAVEAVTVEYPLYQSSSMQLRNKLVAVGTGGIISRGVDNITTITALEDVSFSLGDGDRVGLVGHNGAGKSTLLRTLAGIYTPTRGVVRRSGAIASVLQLGAGLDAELNGYENIVRVGMFMGKSLAQARGLIADIEAFSQLGEFLSMPVYTYSAGMLTRLTFAIATAVAPEILLIDEVLGVGDAEFQHRAKSRLDGLVSSVRIFVLASHSEAIIDQYCNRKLRFEHGRLVSDERM